MSWYRTIDVRMWGDGRFRSLSTAPSAQHLWIYLLCGPHVTPLPGLSAVGEMSLAESLRWPLPSFRKCFAELLDLGMAFSDWTTGVLFLPKAIFYRRPSNPNVVKGWKPYWDIIPECELKDQAAQVFMDAISIRVDLATAFLTVTNKRLGERLGERFAKPFGDPPCFSYSISNSNREEANASCPEPERPARGPSPGLIEFPCVGRGEKTWSLTQEWADRFREAFPGVDVMHEARKALLWVQANPERRKTARGMPRFLTGWLSRAQNQLKPPADPGRKQETREQRDARILRERQARKEERERAARLDGIAERMREAGRRPKTPPPSPPDASDRPNDRPQTPDAS